MVWIIFIVATDLPQPLSVAILRHVRRTSQKRGRARLLAQDDGHDKSLSCSSTYINVELTKIWRFWVCYVKLNVKIGSILTFRVYNFVL